MMSLFSVLLVAVLNLVPADVDSFTMQMHPEKTTHFARQASGSWMAMDLPDDESHTYRVEGGTLIVEHAGKVHRQELGKMLGIDDSTDWATVESLTLANRPLAINRLENGVDLVRPAYSDTSPAQTYTVRWKQP
jgi:hypothetical protein